MDSEHKEGDVVEEHIIDEEEQIEVKHLTRDDHPSPAPTTEASATLPPPSPVLHIEPDIICIGAGPVGLWTSIQAKLLAPKSEVLVVEKYREYQRSHILRLDPTSFKHSARNAEFKALIRAIPSVVRTNDLEDRLLGFAKKIGIKLLFENVTSVEELVARFPTARAVIGADGSHSIARKTVCNNEMSLQEALQCTVEVKYEVQGEARKLNMVTQVYPLLKTIGFIAEEHIGKQRDGKTPVTVRLLVDDKVNKAMSDATFKNPYRFETHKDKMPKHVYEALKLWLNAKAYWTGEKRLPGEKITTLKLSVYTAKKVVAQIPTSPSAKHKHVEVFLAGDSAFGVPFFRALNNGLLCGTHLAFTVARIADPTIASNFNKLETALDSTFEKTKVGSFFAGHWKMAMTNIGGKHAFEHTPSGYGQFFQTLSNNEIVLARSKRAFLGLAITANKVNGASPFQTNVISDKILAIFREDGYLLNPSTMPQHPR